ncbi:MAG TPA: helix-turn-helix transcriptional regulator [Candidatus Limnocylindria bacterium]|nr:helix-turn-helix transcriptional regulator [Candidatus Limnocylindria bacterium]
MSRTTSSKRRAADQAAKIGAEVKLARGTNAMTAQQAADRAGVSWSTEARVELGDPKVSIDTLCAVTEAVGLDLVLKAYEGRRPTLRDTGQLTLAEQLCAQVHPSTRATIELLVGQHGEAIDVALFGAEEIAASEIERLLVDLQDQYRRADRKRQALAAMHQRPVRLIMVFEDTPRNRAAFERHADFIRSVLPAESREILARLRSGRPLGRDGVLWLRRRSQPPSAR